MVCEYGALCVAGGSVLGCSVRLNCANAVSAETSSSPRITSPRTSARIGLRMGHASRNMDGMRRNVPPALRVNFPHGEPRLLWLMAVSYTHLRAHETVLDLVCRLLLEK